MSLDIDLLKIILDKLNNIENDLLSIKNSPIFSSIKQEPSNEPLIEPIKKPEVSETELEGWKLTLRNKKYWYLWKYCVKENGKVSQEWLYIGRNPDKAKEVLAKNKGKCLSPEKQISIEIKKPQEEPQKPIIQAVQEVPEKTEEIKPLLELPLNEYLKRIEIVNATTKEMFDNIENPKPPLEKKSQAYLEEFKAIMEKSGWKFIQPDTFRKKGNQFELKSNEIGLLRVGERKKKQKIVISNFNPIQLSDVISLGIPSENPVIITTKGGKTIKSKLF